MLRRGMEPGGTGAGMARGESVSVCDSGSGGKPAGGARRRRQPRAFLRALALPFRFALVFGAAFSEATGPFAATVAGEGPLGTPGAGVPGRGGPGAPGVPGAGRNPAPGTPEVRRNVLRGVRARGSGRTREPPRGVLSRVRSARAAPRRCAPESPAVGDGARRCARRRRQDRDLRTRRTRPRTPRACDRARASGGGGVRGEARGGREAPSRQPGPDEESRGGGDRGGGNRGRGGGDGGRRRRL